MIKLYLRPNEGIILQRESALREMGKKDVSGTLVLTNFNLYHISTQGKHKKTDDIVAFPVNQIKVVNGIAQVFLGGNSLNPALQILFMNGQEEFTFVGGRTAQTKKEIVEWINGISQLLGVNAPKINAEKNAMAIPGAKEIASTLKDTVGVFKETMGLKSKGEAPVENVTCKCIGCMAPLSGVKGQTVRCKYCDTEQTL